MVSSVNVYIALMTFASEAHYDYHLTATPNMDGVLYLTRDMVGASYVYGRIVASSEVTVYLNITLGGEYI